MISGDTIAAIATAPGRGGVAVVRVSGPEAFAIGERLTGKPPKAGKICLREIGVGKRRADLLDVHRHLPTPIDAY